ncbi:hypothetical protein ACQEVF_23050 [Nonomuraea polychroma]|uniref:hypothetical protein n=1 Tax=Nonomuraea polychroma TaxID=46176 RepID=UPI003D91A4F0
MRTNIRRGLIAATAAVVFTVTNVAPALADSSSGNCSSLGYSATGRANYTTGGTGVRYISSFSWTINGQSGSTKNDVIIELKRDDTLRPDPVLYTWSTGSARNGDGSHTPPYALEMPVLWRVYARYHFIFDRNNLGDPECYARTSNF